MALNVSELCASYSDINMFENWAWLDIMNP